VKWVRRIGFGVLAVFVLLILSIVAVGLAPGGGGRVVIEPDPHVLELF
jgi:hypothetical protein